MTRDDGAPRHGAKRASLDSSCDRLTGSVQEYLEPFEPVSAEEREVHDHTAVSAAVMRTMTNIAREWECTEAEMASLLGMEVAKYRMWSSDPARAALDGEQIERASLLLGVYAALVTLLPLAERQCWWLHHPNQGALFQGRPPIACLRHGGLSALRELRMYLDAELQGGFA